MGISKRRSKAASSFHIEVDLVIFLDIYRERTGVNPIKLKIMYNYSYKKISVINFTV